jgi:hypothetical protein
MPGSAGFRSCHARLARFVSEPDGAMKSTNLLRLEASDELVEAGIGIFYTVSQNYFDFFVNLT